jgi:Fic family protein
MGTRSEVGLQTEAGLARARRMPFDPSRIELFATLSAYLLQKELPKLASRAETKQAKNNLAFFEAYFSNYIEGTEFAIEEAEQIVFENKIFPERPEDSHDILETYRLVSDDHIMQTVPKSDEEFFSLLLDRHAILMQARESTLPGKFKNVVNRAGNTIFVKPEEVRGTMCKGFEFYEKLKPGLARAIFIKFLISEVHPFIDGNGRIARIFMNAELQACSQCRIIIPTVYREDYLLALRKLSRGNDPAPYTRMLLIAQNFTHSISFETYPQALIQLRASNAFLEPSEGKLRIIST